MLITDLSKQISRRLHEREMQGAKHGIGGDPIINIEIEDLSVAMRVINRLISLHEARQLTDSDIQGSIVSLGRCGVSVYSIEFGDALPQPRALLADLLTREKDYHMPHREEAASALGQLELLLTNRRNIEIYLAKVQYFGNLALCPPEVQNSLSDLWRTNQVYRNNYTKLMRQYHQRGLFLNIHDEIETIPNDFPPQPVERQYEL